MSKISDGRDLDRLGEVIKVDPNFLLLWIAGSPPGFGYDTFSIPKRSGSYRTINAPNAPLMQLQHQIYRKLLRDELVPTVVNGFVPNRSIVQNALPHVQAQIIVKIDLKDFFGSISKQRIYRYWVGEGWDSITSEVLAQICCFKGRLPQGAPTSPALSNLVNRVLDGMLLRLAQAVGVNYTRYADDLTFSFPKKQSKAEGKVSKLVDSVIRLLRDEGYEIQWKKGVKVLRPHQRQVITGIVVNDSINLPRRTRRQIRAMRHQKTLGKLSESDERRLTGYESLLLMVERFKKPRKQVSLSKPEIDKVNATKDERDLSIGQANLEQLMSILSGFTNKVGGNTIVIGDIVGGNQIKAGDNLGGIQNLGEFEKSISKLSSSNNESLAKALAEIAVAIGKSRNLKKDEKIASSEVLSHITEEATRDSPNKPKLQILWKGLVATLSSAADIAQILTSATPIYEGFLSSIDT